ncbi:MAG: hypothetical protein WAQ08_15850, partial [Aquabacterium sp.]|uniref:hypothetical protein n=1 Tax=Aquabacterium sp. TaxID=1872578 RepID=UPI003BAF3DF5
SIMASSRARKKSGVLICSGPQNSQKLSVIAHKTESSDQPQLPDPTCIHRDCGGFARPTLEPRVAIRMPKTL